MLAPQTVVKANPWQRSMGVITTPMSSQSCVVSKVIGLTSFGTEVNVQPKVDIRGQGNISDYLIWLRAKK